MCGRYSLSTPGELVAEIFGLDEAPPLEARYNVAPTQEAPVIRRRAPAEAPRLDMLRWGLVPYWADDPAIGGRMINARAESAARKPAFREPFRQRRCLVPADGFYEWRQQSDGKQPYHIRRRDGRPFGFAGLWARWRPRGPAGQLRLPGLGAGPEAVTPLETFTILTCVPNAVVRPLHDRMPVILPEASFGRWLDPGVDDPAELLSLLQPVADDALEAVPVSRYVNRPENEGPECVEPVREGER